MRSDGDNDIFFCDYDYMLISFDYSWICFYDDERSFCKGFTGGSPLSTVLHVITVCSSLNWSWLHII